MSLNTVFTFVKAYINTLLTTGETFQFTDGRVAYLSTDTVSISPLKREGGAGRRPKTDRVSLEKLATLIRGVSYKGLLGQAMLNDGTLNINGTPYEADAEGLYARPEKGTNPAKVVEPKDHVYCDKTKEGDYARGIGIVAAEVAEQFKTGKIGVETVSA